MTSHLYEEVDNKLRRIAQCMAHSYWDIGVHFNNDTIVEAVKDINRLRQELRYEYLGLKESWL